MRLPGYRNMDHRTTIYGVPVIFAVYNFVTGPPYDHIWSASNLRRLQLRDMDHRTTIYGASVILAVYFS